MKIGIPELTKKYHLTYSTIDYIIKSFEKKQPKRQTSETPIKVEPTEVFQH